MDLALAKTMLLIGALGLVVGWVLTALVEEQVIGRPTREPRREARRGRTTATRSVPAKLVAAKPSGRLPRAVARPRSVVASRSAS